MPNIVKINSDRALVSFTQKDLIEHNLLRYVRSSFKGIGKEGLLTDHPFETVAAELYIEKNPSDQVKLAEKCLLIKDKEGSVGVDVVLRIAENFSGGMYQENPNKIIFKHQDKKKG